MDKNKLKWFCSDFTLYRALVLFNLSLNYFLDPGNKA